MVVTKLEAQKKNPNRVNLYIDDVFLCGISANTLVDRNLYVKKEIDEQEVNEILNIETFNRFLDKALTYLSSSIKSRSQLKQYLDRVAYKKKGEWYSEDSGIDIKETIEKVLTRLETLGYINDSHYAHVFVESRTRNKPRSKMQLRTELITKGISKEIIDEILLNINNDEEIVKVYRKRFGDEKIDKEDTKKMNFLLRKGFSYDEIDKLIRTLADDTSGQW